MHLQRSIEGWQEIRGSAALASPALVVDADRVAANIDAMGAIVAKQPARLCPHVKTHKMPDVLKLQQQRGIDAFKVATLAEADLVGRSGARSCLLAHAPVGPKAERLRELAARYPQTRWTTVVDAIEPAGGLATVASRAGSQLDVLVDVDCGMQRTGVAWGEPLSRLLEELARLDSLRVTGLHVYDGHLHDPDLGARRDQVDAIAAQIANCLAQHHLERVVVGGSPTFALWAEVTSPAGRLGREFPEMSFQCSPGTTFFWDQGYGNAFPELPFAVAAALWTRVISLPGTRRVCLDLGHKAVASEMPLEQRVWLPALPGACVVGHSEEHLVLELAEGPRPKIGAGLWAFPKHICPTVALHDAAVVVREGRVTEEAWPVAGRWRLSGGGG